MIDQEEQRARQEIQHTMSFGMDVEAFIQSSIGRYLIGRAEQERDEALEGLKDVNPFNPEGIRTLQNKIWVAESIQTWLAEAIEAGHTAERVFQESPD